ncbi:MotA/TolQ/ExbB proton channel family protein [Duganella sp. FT92W]|uniref:MotA/TolQ/ExbB proton channel family protein n=1 Tax=Pseudoduganella rivuli TaxID=2666085 RepID=A0A7X2IKS0_9BURK|nr:MotA/TolQ/ExbB proton channel family protein [Pseudoduganella rivuli]MRV71826.1 MotA/TolQ/ExbB proton channel family protein [Pseudoduganella rivuli]
MRSHLFRFALLALVPAGGAYAADINLVEQASEGGLALLAILALSVLMLAVSLERLLHLRVRHIVPAGLADAVLPLWRAGDFALAELELTGQDNTLARVIAYMAAHRHLDYDRVSAGAGDIASLELRRHQQKFYALSIVATVAPIVGLLGTVVGMIEAFHVIAFADGMGNPALLAGGISKALVNTAAGLCVALPALGMHHFFKHRTALLALTLEQDVNRLLQACFPPRPAGQPGLQVVPHAH